MLIERAEQTRDLELTPFRGDGGIDVHAIVDRDLFYASLGVQSKQYQPDNTVGVNTLRSFKGALTDQNYHIGTVITTSSFTDGAKESAEKDSIRLIDGDRLLDIMMESQIGILQVEGDQFELDSEFWEAFVQPEDTDVIPSLEVPQADNFDVVRLVLQAVDAGVDMKPKITGYLE
jgi:restriction system protein